MLRLYDNHLSGNGYKPRLLLAHLGLTYERIELDILTGETRTADFLALNANGRIPLLVLEGGNAAGRIQRDPVVSRGRLALPAGRAAGAGADPAMDVLRAIQSRAQHRGRTPLAPACRDDGRATRPASGEAGGRPRRAGGDGTGISMQRTGSSARP